MPLRNDLRFLWILCILVAPLILVLIELFHPAGFTKTPGMFDFLREPMPPEPDHDHNALDYFGPNWWFWLHMIQTPSVVLISFGLMLTVRRWITQNEGVWLAAVTGWGALAALFIFMVYYTVLDAIGGIGLGRTLVLVNQMQAAGDLDPAQLSAIAALLNGLWVDPWVGGVGSWVSLTGSWAIFVATILAAVTALLANRGGNALLWVALALLVAGGWFVQASHACCTGPLGFGLIFLFGCVTYWSDRKA